MMSKPLVAMLLLSKTTSPPKLFQSDCFTQYIHLGKPQKSSFFLVDILIREGVGKWLSTKEKDLFLKMFFFVLICSRSFKH